MHVDSTGNIGVAQSSCCRSRRPRQIDTARTHLCWNVGAFQKTELPMSKRFAQIKACNLNQRFLFDALQEEQEQGISIDTTRVNFEFDGHKFILIDAPGHLEFLKNMTSGASEADLGILVVDGNQGVRSQTERHLKILNMLGVRRVIVALNKIDQIKYDQTDI